jgi:biotin--protein ligase
VENGGKYLGICAGAYYACGEIEFEKGTPLEVVGERELRFFPGLCRGTTFPGFEYETESGARETSLILKREAWRDHWSQSPDLCEVWYNGGGSFILDAMAPPKGVKVLAEYEETEPRQVAGVLCTVGQGQALLWAVHPEHPSLDTVEGTPRQEKELQRLNLVRGTLGQLGLDVSDGPAPLPKLLPLVLASSDPSLAQHIASEIASRGEPTSTSTVGLTDRNDTFILHPASSFDSLVRSARSRQGTSDPEELRQEHKMICVCDEGLIPTTSTPLFDISTYFANLSQLSNGNPSIGQALLYGEVVTSTQTMLDKYVSLPFSQPSAEVVEKLIS